MMNELLLLAQLTAGAPVQLQCMPLESARTIIGTLTKSHPELAVIEWRDKDARTFLSLTPFRINRPVVDVLFFFRFPEGNSAFAVGSTSIGESCGSISFVMSKEATEEALAKFYGQGPKL